MHKGCRIGFAILTQSLKFIYGKGYSQNFDDDDSNGGKILAKIQNTFSGRESPRRFGFFLPKPLKQMSIARTVLPLIDTNNWNKH